MAKARTCNTVASRAPSAAPKGRVAKSRSLMALAAFTIAAAASFGLHESAFAGVSPRRPSSNVRVSAAIAEKTQWFTPFLHAMIGRTAAPELPPLPKLDAKKEDFEQAVMGGRPFLVDFSATWCGPCKLMDPVIAGLQKQYEGRVSVMKLDVDDNKNLAGSLRIRRIPAVLLFSGSSKHPVARLSGIIKAEAISEAIDLRLLS